LGITLTNVISNGDFSNGLTGWDTSFTTLDVNNWAKIGYPGAENETVAVTSTYTANQYTQTYISANDWVLYKFRVQVLSGMDHTSTIISQQPKILFGHGNMNALIDISGPFTNGQYIDVCMKFQVTAAMLTDTYSYRLFIGFNSKRRQSIARIDDVMVFNLTTCNAATLTAEELNTLTPGYAASYPYPFEDKLITKTT
jgi:hypothetical protein